jgi:hypothetical protein
MANHKHFKRGQNPTFKCVTCERNTRDTGQGVDHLCEDCFEIAGLDNQVNDSGEPVTKAILQECTDRLAKIKKLGGNAERVKAANTYIWAAPKKETPKPNPDGMDIPDFLKRGKDNKPKAGSNYEGVHPAKKSGILKRSQAERSAAGKPFFAPPKEPTLLETLEPVEFREYVEKEIKAGRVQGKWLSDSSTVGVLRSQWGGKEEKKQEGLARLAEYKAEHPKPPAKPKAVHAEDALHILHHDTANPRKVGSANHAKYESFKAFMVKCPRATVGEVLAGTKYYRNDLMWDVKQGRIKLGEAPAPEQPPAKAKPTPAAKKEAKGLPPIKAKRAPAKAK